MIQWLCSVWGAPDGTILLHCLIVWIVSLGTGIRLGAKITVPILLLQKTIGKAHHLVPLFQ